MTIEGVRVAAVEPHPDDPAPTPLLDNFLDGIGHVAHVRRPAIRTGWLDHGPGPDERRGADEFVEVDWPEALDLLAGELRRVRDEHGNESIYGGSYDDCPGHPEHVLVEIEKVHGEPPTVSPHRPPPFVDRG